MEFQAEIFVLNQVPDDGAVAEPGDADGAGEAGAPGEPLHHGRHGHVVADALRRYSEQGLICSLCTILYGQYEYTTDRL